MKKISTTILFLIAIFQIMAQSSYNANIPQYIPRTPQADAFARYGEYPINHSTGVPQIDIPLYKISHHDITVPISISYHASGIKVEDLATPVGLGWSLNTGGYIIRSTRSGVDNQGHTNSRVKSEKHAKELQNSDMDIDRTWRLWMSRENESNESDRYIYSFNGKTGVFRYNTLNNNELITIPYAPIQIEATKEGFKMKDTDGLIYYFEDGDKLLDRSRSVEYHYVTWYITKIESQLTRTTINYRYKKGTQYEEVRHSHIQKKGTSYTVEPVPPEFGNYKLVERLYDNQSDFINNYYSHHPILIDEIAWGDNKIKFNYTTDRKDRCKDRLTNLDIYVQDQTIRTVSFDNNSYWGDDVLNYRMRLNSLEIKGENRTLDGEKYYFKYNNSIQYNYPNIDDGGLTDKNFLVAWRIIGVITMASKQNTLKISYLSSMLYAVE